MPRPIPRPTSHQRHFTLHADEAHDVLLEAGPSHPREEHGANIELERSAATARQSYLRLNAVMRCQGAKGCA